MDRINTTMIIIRELITEGLLQINFGNAYVLWDKMDAIGVAGVLLGLITFAAWLFVTDFDYSDKMEKIVKGLFIAFFVLSTLMTIVGIFALIKIKVMDAEVERAMLLSNVDFGALIKSLNL